MMPRAGDWSGARLTPLSTLGVIKSATCPDLAILICRAPFPSARHTLLPTSSGTAELFAKLPRLHDSETFLSIVEISIHLQMPRLNFSFTASAIQDFGSHRVFRGHRIGNLLLERGLRDDALQAYAEALRYAAPDQQVCAPIDKQIALLNIRPPVAVKSLRDPMLE